MLVRTTYLRLTDEHRGERARARIATHLREALSARPRVRGTEVGLAADPASKKGWDVFVHLRFDRPEDISAFEADPETVAVMDQVAAGIGFEKTWVWEMV